MALHMLNVYLPAKGKWNQDILLALSREQYSLLRRHVQDQNDQYIQHSVLKRPFF